MNDRKLKAIDFFCSGGGMTHGMRKAGIDVIAGIDIDQNVRETYESNNPGTFFIEKDISEMIVTDLFEFVDIKVDDDDFIFIGCSPCQYWSIINTNKQKAKKSKDLLNEFKRFALFYRPGYVVVENVPGLLNKSKESGLTLFINELETLGYTVEFGVYNLNEYGVPQTRKRFSLIATRVTQNRILPKKSNDKLKVKDIIGVKNGFPQISAGHRDNSSFQHTSANLSPENFEVIRNTPKNSGISIKERKAFKGKGFGDSYSRMSWDKPAPTITTRFLSVSNGRFAHPEEDRAISIREGACLQTFPRDYVFYSTSIHKIAQMIGNAVPPEFAKRIGEAIINDTNDSEEN